MADLRLTEFVLLSCNFEFGPEEEGEEVDESDERVDEGSESSAAGSDEDAQPSQDEPVRLRYQATREDDEFVFFLDAELLDPTLPFTLQVLTGSRFEIHDAPDLTPEAANATLLFMTYPYVRELISNITGRSPSPGVILPPLTRLPHPDVSGPEGRDDG
jgi:hypothetical protein